MMLVSYVDALDLDSGLEYARRKLRRASIMGRIFGFKDDRDSVNILRRATGLIHGYIELAAALEIRRRHGGCIPLYVREVGDLSHFNVDRVHLSSLPKIRITLSDKPLPDNFILWNGRLLWSGEGFLPYFAGPRLADVEVYERGRATLYDITVGGRDVLQTKGSKVRKFRPSFPASKVSWKILRFNWEVE